MGDRQMLPKQTTSTDISGMVVQVNRKALLTSCFTCGKEGSPIHRTAAVSRSVALLLNDFMDMHAYLYDAFG